jgi:hypothetical protein
MPPPAVTVAVVSADGEGKRRSGRRGEGEESSRGEACEAGQEEERRRI